jgi:peptidoglycan/LPS O-acetylase OafA/YrhL
VSTSPSPAVIPALDGVRGLAIASVMWFHLAPRQAPGGWMGMSVFFPLSGFLVTRVMLQQRARTGRVDVAGFYGRRARRLLPALYVLLIVVLAWSAVSGRWTTDDLRAALSAVFYVNNWWQLHHTVDYWALFRSGASPFEHLWSLSVEEQFYLVWPLLAWVATATRRPHRNLAVVAATLSLAGCALGVWLGHRGVSMTGIYYHTVVRGGELMAGAALAVVIAAKPALLAHRRAWLEGMAMATLGGMVIVWCRLDASAAHFVARGGMFVTGIGTCIIIAAALAPGILTDWLSCRPLRWLGTRCYGLYLWHWPVVVLVNERSIDLHGSLLLVVRLALTLAATVPSFWWVEQRFRPRRPST